jgi:Cu/Ag efflux pump CusA
VEVARLKLLALGVGEADVRRVLEAPGAAPLSSLPIRSPIAGVVSRADVQVGQLVKDVADVRFAGPVARGDGGVQVREGGKVAGGPAVVMTVLKQLHFNTLTLTAEIDAVLNQAERELPPGVKLERHIFRQADFIQAAVGNVAEAVRDGALWVLVILFVFLWNFRTSLITLTAIPLSILVTALVFHAFGLSVNTMTLGGIAVAVGELVDDAIVDVENIFRRLKENRLKANPDPPLKVVFLASSEVRGSIVYATLIVCVVVLPLFALGGPRPGCRGARWRWPGLACAGPSTTT